MKVLLGQDMYMERGERIDSSVKSYLIKVIGKGEDAWDMGLLLYNDHCII